MAAASTNTADAHPNRTSTAAADAGFLRAQPDLPPGLFDSTLGRQDLGVELSLFGFGDFTFSKSYFDRNRLLAAFTPRNSNFYVGNLNTYIRSSFDDFTFLTEIRFLYQPNGAASLAGDYTDTTTTDHADLNRSFRHGSIEIERAWLEYALDPRLVIRVGQWLTPYGVWNVDHGSPTVIAVRRPYSIGDELFPERQTGVQLWGVFGLGPVDLAYSLTISNGRGPIDAYQDLDGNKALGGRVLLRYAGRFNLELGASAYGGQYTLDAGAPRPGLDLDFVPDPEILEQYDEVSLAVDLVLRLDGLRLQIEVISNQRWYTMEGRPNYPVASGGFFPNDHRWGAYVLLAYETDVWGITPFVIAERNIPETNYVQIRKFTTIGAGLNIRMHPRVTLKIQGNTASVDRSPGTRQLRVGSLDLQAAWAF